MKEFNKDQIIFCQQVINKTTKGDYEVSKLFQLIWEGIKNNEWDRNFGKNRRIKRKRII